MARDYIGYVLPKGGGGGGTGRPGRDGTTFTPSVSAEGLLSWTNDGGKTNPEPVNIKGPTGDGGGSLAADLKVSNPIGRYASGDVIPAGTSFDAITKGILSKTYYPTLTEPRAVLNYNIPSILAAGKIVSAGTAQVTLNRGSINPQYTADSAYRSGAATGYSLKVEGASITFDQNNTTGSFNVPAFTKSTKGKVTVTATANYGQGVQPKDSDGNNYDSPLATGSKTATKEITFVIPFYWGITGDKDNIDFSALTQDITGKENKAYTYTTVKQHPVIAYDADHGALSSIKDQNGFETINGWTKTVQDGKNVYVFDNATTDPSQKYTFTF